MMQDKRESAGLLLVVMSGVLALLLLLASVFVVLAREVRATTRTSTEGARAKLLARTGVEYAVSRLLEDPQGDPDDPENDWRYREEAHTPLEKAANPSYNSDPYADSNHNGRYDLSDPFDDPDGNGRYDGWSGRLRGTHIAYSDRFKLEIADSNSRIHINGGALDAGDRDPDGPGADTSMFVKQPGLIEVAPLQPNGIPDYRDASNEGPNGFLVRLLNNLERVVSGTEDPALGKEIVGQRPEGGYSSLSDLAPILGKNRLNRFSPYLTTHAWVDEKVVKPQPINDRPNRWLDIDDPHRIGSPAKEISGYGINPPNLARVSKLHPDISGEGTEDSPWEQIITAENGREGVYDYPVRWERNFIYAWKQLRLGPVQMEPRAPVSIDGGSGTEVLAAVFLGLKGTYLEVWDGSAGWDSGFGFYENDQGLLNTHVFRLEQVKYSYPRRETTEAPWHRTRVDYGRSYGTASRPWYGPEDYDPDEGSAYETYTAGGKPVIWSAPLGRLKETVPLAKKQVLSLSEHLAETRHEKSLFGGPIRSWAGFNVFVERLPVWEDVNNDLVLDGEGYDVIGADVSSTAEARYKRRIYRREDRNSNGVMNRQIFREMTGDVADTGAVFWEDRMEQPLGSGDVPGLTFVQKDVLRAMTNPNTDLNDFNPDLNLWKEVDKTDVTGIETIRDANEPSPDASAYVHTTELALEASGAFQVTSFGRIASGHHGVKPETDLSRHAVSAVLELWSVHRDTTQSDFMQGAQGGLSPGRFTGVNSPYRMAGDQSLVSYPELQTYSYSGNSAGAGADYDGQIALGWIGAMPAEVEGGEALQETIRGDLFDSLHALETGDEIDPDVNGPYHARLIAGGGEIVGSVYPDGVYSEKDASLKFPLPGNYAIEEARFREVEEPVNETGRMGAEAYRETTGRQLSDPDLKLRVKNGVFYFSFWKKPSWFPEASPRPHALLSLSPAPTSNHHDTYWKIPKDRVPLEEIRVRPVGLYFVPARNNLWETEARVYGHAPTTARGKGWPRRSLLWGTVHALYMSDNLNRWGIETPPVVHPKGRLEGHQWTHVAVVAAIDITGGGANRGKGLDMILGRHPASVDGVGGGWNSYGFTTAPPYGAQEWARHRSGEPNHLRLGEVAAEHNMNYTADATFANVRMGYLGGESAEQYMETADGLAKINAWFSGSKGPAALGRYYKEERAEYRSFPVVEEEVFPLRTTWTEIPVELWFDLVPDGWLDARLDDRFGAGGGIQKPNGLRDVRIDLEVWDDMNTEKIDDDRLLLASSDPAAENRIPKPVGRIYYKGVFVNEWDETTRLNHPLDVTPFLDDVTIFHVRSGGPRLVRYEEEVR